MDGFGKDIRDSRKEYRKLIREIFGKEKDFLSDVKYGMILGGESFVGWIQNKFIDRKEENDVELPQKKRISDNGVLDRSLLMGDPKCPKSGKARSLGLSHS